MPPSHLVSATFRFIPLSFFENTTGELRFLESESATEGTPLEPGAWMVTVGEGLMMATSTAWILKNISLNDWLLYAERNGRPVLRATSTANPGTDDWHRLQSALDDILTGNAVVHSSTEDIKVVDLGAGGNVPFPALVERIDRMIAALWRGADLSTLSRDRGYGASLQEKESCALEADDAEMLTETLNRYVDEWVIQHVFGEGVQPLANVKVLVTPTECTATDIEVDRFLLESGARLSLQELLTRYGRAMPKPGEEVVCTNPTPPVGPVPPPGAPTMPNQELVCTTPIAPVGPVPPPGVPTPPGAPTKPTTPVGPVPPPGAPTMPNQELVCTNPTAPVGPVPSPGVPTPSGAPTNPIAPVGPVPSPGAPSAFSAVDNTALPNASFALLQPDWVQLTPYGDFPHSRGLQRVDRAAADLMVARFNSFRGRLGRLFGGAPFYVGHPDMPNTSDTADRKAYGWVEKLEARDDGLYGLVKWSDAGLELLRSAHYKYYSPFWEAREIRGADGQRVFQPIALISVGLTNQPNIPVKPLANTSTPRSSQGDEAKIQNSDVRHAPFDFPPSALSAFSAVENSPRRFPNLHQRSLTHDIAHRRAELHTTTSRGLRIQNAVQAKMRLGLNYDDAWQAVKKEHIQWFANEY